MPQVGYTEMLFTKENMIDLKISDFPPPYTHINGHQNLVVSKYDIARAGMTVGYPKLLNAISTLGVYRFLELFFRTRAYLEIHNNSYQLNPIFFLLDSSEQKTISYFFGQALTKLFAEQYLNCDQVDDFRNHVGNISFLKSGQKFRPKKQLYNSNKTPKEPDLIGFSGNDYHILEAKGYSSGFNGSVFQHAINQVSIIGQVNGKQPLTKTACFFDLSGNPFLGRIQDPDDETMNIDIEFDKKAFLNNYYNLFNLEKLKRRSYWTFTFNGNEFAGFRLFDAMHPHLLFGVDYDLFKQINSNGIIDFKKKEYESIKGNQYASVGSDGIIFIDTIRNKNLNIERVSA